MFTSPRVSPPISSSLAMAISLPRALARNRDGQPLQVLEVLDATGVDQVLAHHRADVIPIPTGNGALVGHELDGHAGRDGIEKGNRRRATTRVKLAGAEDGDHCRGA